MKRNIGFWASLTGVGLSVLGFLAVAAISLLVGLLLTHVILDIARLYVILPITQNFTFLSMYGLTIVIGLCAMQISKDKGDDLKTGFWKSIVAAIAILITWGYSYIVYWIIC